MISLIQGPVTTLLIKINSYPDDEKDECEFSHEDAKLGICNDRNALNVRFVSSAFCSM